MRRLRRALHPAYVWDLFVASDPDLGRLRQGLRALLSAGLAALVVSQLARWLGEPPTVAMIATMIAMMGSQLASDADPRAQRVTTLLLMQPAMTSVILGTLAAPHPWLGAGLFAVTVFVSTAVRRFGPRGLALGMIGCMAVFVSLYFRAQPAQLPALLGAIALAIGIAYVMRFVLLRDDPERNRRRFLRALRLTVANGLWRLATLPERPRMTRSLERQLRREAERLNDAALGVEDLLDGHEPALRLRVFDLELGAERVIGAVAHMVESDALPASARAEVRCALLAAHAAVRSGAPEGHEAVREHLSRVEDSVEGAPDPERARRVARRLGTSLPDLVEAAANLLEEASSVSRPSGEGRSAGASTGAPLREQDTPRGLHPSTRQALQATVATVLAMAAGYAVSSTRWYWAAITSFVIFVRTRTLGETLLRGWYRVLGTLLGVVAGLLLAGLLSGHRTVELATVFVCIFFAFYLIRVSYAWMVFWITLVLSVLYSLLGRFTPELLYLRVEETLIGAGMGMFIATIMLPERTTGLIRSAVTDVLSALGTYLDALARPGDADEARLLDAMRALDAKLRELRARGRPLTGRLVRFAPRTAREVHAVSVLVLFARHLALGRGSMVVNEAARERMREAAGLLAGNARALSRALERGEAPVLPSALPLLAEARRALTEEESVPRGPASAPVMLHWLARVDDTLSLLAETARPPARRNPTSSESGVGAFGTPRRVPGA